MTSLTTIILGLSIAYALLGVLLLGASVYSQLPLPLKATAILVTSTFYVVSFLEPIQEHIESNESVVIRYWVLDSRRSAQCGSLSTGVQQSVMAFVTRAI
jgi:hypothetical protein